MRLSPLAKSIVGALTAWPVVYIVFFFVFLATSFGGFDTGVFETVFVVHAVTAVMCLGLLGFYVLHALQNPRLEGTHRMLWALMFLVGGLIAMPVYWLLHIRAQAR